MRGIPSISDYSHWNEDAELMWYQENRYDMMYGDEYIYDDDPYSPEYDDYDELDEVIAIDDGYFDYLDD